MTPLDALLILSLAAGILGLIWFRARSQRLVAAIAIVTVAIVLAHAALQDYRWPLLLPYAVALAIVVAAIVMLRGDTRQHAPSRRSRFFQVAVSIFGLLVVGVGAAVVWAFPLFEPPEPSGAHRVGVTRIHMVDEARGEAFADDPAARRELMVHIWYPADPEPGSSPAPYLHESRVVTGELLGALGLPRFMFNHLSQITGHAYEDAPAAADRPFPVLVFSHGYFQGFAGQNVSQMEELASRGYAVVSIERPYESIAVVYPDGRTITVDKDAATAFEERITPLYEAWEEADDPNERFTNAQRVLQIERYNERVVTWAADTSFVLDELERLADDDQFILHQALALSEIGVFGHSFGGAAAVQACLDDERAVACLNMDGAQWGDLLESQTDKPLMFMFSEPNEGINDPVIENAEGIAYTLLIDNTAHLNFSDAPLWTPLFQLVGAAGSIDGRRGIEVANAYTHAFFARHLLGETAPLLDPGAEQYEEARLTMINR